jgi:hypothetical protein
MVKKFSHKSVKRCLTSFLVTLKQVLVPTSQAAVVLWTFANVTAVNSGSHLQRSSDPLGLQSFHPCALWYLHFKQQLSSGGTSLLSLQCILVTTYHAGVILWAFRFFIPMSSGTYLSSSSCPLGQFTIVTAMHSGSHLPRSIDPLAIRHFYHCVL